MRWTRAASSFAALLVVALGSSTARADFIDWQYNWKPSTSKIFAGELGTTSGVALSDEPGAQAGGNSDIVATNLEVFSSAPRGTPEILDARGDFSLDLTLTDTESGETAVLTFFGKLSGPLSEDSADVELAFTSPETLSVKLGENEYEVTIGPYSPPGPPGANNAGSIGAHVDVNPDDRPVEDVPEPSTMVLSCIGLMFVGFASWRARRRTRPAVSMA